MCYYANTLYVKTVKLSIPVLQIFLDPIQIRYQDPAVVRKKIRRIQFFVQKTLSAAILRPLPEPPQIPEWQVIEFISSRKINQQERNSLLLFKFSHKPHLMFMDIGKGKGGYTTFLGIEANRDPLDSSNIIHSTLLLKISQGDMMAFLVHPYRGDGSGDFLDQSQSLLPVLLIGTVYQFLKSGTA